MGYTAKQKSYIAEFEANWKGHFGPSSSWDLYKKEAYNNALAKYISANPQIFSPEQIDVAREVEATPFRDLETFKLGDAVSVFFSEAGNQAERINPFSGINRTALWIVAGLAIVTVSAVVAYKATPKVPVKK
ncbi:hypothetical protein DDZ13_06610 [Coraliomargarita sinensis]|uniref:Uncharacterized protein n=1 Tax=Coraliomargarita sinensis TaxID=2174842 RepID=A0A317ZN51_9BACT|nr:hypothetical protein [Coraliomargarita sinensis]PXA04831.1 hypothetical protein DDZ13_06610 [Coraliomargarita sinensis]